MNRNASESDVPNAGFIILAFVQGMVLFTLHQALEHEMWPATHFGWMMAIYSVVIALPLVVYLTANCNQARGILFYASVAVCAAGIGAYTGWQMEPKAHVGSDYVMLSYVPTAVVAVFLTSLLRLHRVQGLDWYYASWRIAITGAWAWLFTFACFLVLSLWGGLFEALSISFFKDLFQETWFMYPVFSIAFAAGVIVFRSKSNFSESLIRLQQIATPFFLLVAVAIVLMFVVTLMFTGLKPLWDSGGSTLVLAFQALILYLMNAAYHGDETRLPKFANALVKLGLLVMPVLSGIIAYGLYLRVAQYGWTVSRLWGASIALVFASFGLFYAYSVARSGQFWLRRIEDFNGRLVWVVLVFVILVNTPLLDFRRITVADQLGRVEQGLISPEDLDVWYLGKSTGRPGYIAMQGVKERYGQQYPKLAERIDRLNLDSNEEVAQLTLETLEDRFVWRDIAQKDRVRPITAALLAELKESPWLFADVYSYRMVELDANSDGVVEYFLVIEHEIEAAVRMFVVDEDNDTGWRSKAVGSIWGKDLDLRTVLVAIDQGNVDVVKPEWQDISLGGQRLSIR